MVHEALYRYSYAEPYNQRVNRILGTVLSSAYSLLAEANPKRRWLAITVDQNSANALLIAFSNSGEPGATTYAPIQISPGGAVIFSRTGDMPWSGPVWAIGDGGPAGVYGTEVVDY